MKFAQIDVAKIYLDYQIPPNLVDHMNHVTQVITDVLNSWHGPKIDAELTILSGRLHDLGNIVKFSKPFSGKIAEQLQADLDYWYQVQANFINKYGSNATRATYLIIDELGLTTSVGQVLRQMEAITKPDDKLTIGYEARILEYADCCVSPEGIVGFEKRLIDLCTRYCKDPKSLWAEALRKNAKIVLGYAN